MLKIDFKYFSKVMDAPTEATVLLPEKDAYSEVKPQPYKCLYLLHGLHGDYTTWTRKCAIERYVDKYNVCVVMPDAKSSFYTDMKYGYKYYTAVAKELPRIICNNFNVSDKREDNYVAGYSMGAYGAIKMALRECDRFSAAAGLSTVADMVSRAKENNEFLDWIFGEERIVPDEDNLFYLAEKMNDNPNKPRLYMGVGTSDSRYPMSVKFKEKLDTLNYDFTYRESEGAHNWLFWDEYIKYVFEWMFE